MDLLNKLQQLCGENQNFTEEILTIQLEAAKCDILNYCHIDSVPPGLEQVQLGLALKRLNRMGQEGSKSYSEGAVSAAFDGYLTDDVKAQLQAFRKVVF